MENETSTKILPGNVNKTTNRHTSELYERKPLANVTDLRGEGERPTTTAAVLLAPAVNRQPGYRREDS